MMTRSLVESFKPVLIHFALSDPITRPMTSPLTSSEIPITQPYPYVIVDLRGIGLELGLELRLGLHASSPKPNVSACAARLFHDVIMLTSSLTKLRVIIIYF